MNRASGDGDRFEFPRRERVHPALVLFWVAVGLALLNVANQAARLGNGVQTVELEQPAPEPVMPAIVVTRDDPFPCLEDLVARQVCEARGCVNRCEGWDR